MKWEDYPDRELAENLHDLWQADPTDYGGITARQLEALRHHVAGYGARRIGRSMGITPQAASAHLDAAYRKIDRAKEAA